MSSQTTTAETTIIADDNDDANICLESSTKKKIETKNLGIPVGVVKIRSKHVQEFRTLLDTILGPPIRFRHVEKCCDDDDDDDWVLLHVPSLAAASLLRKDPPQQLLDFLTNHSATFVPWVRRKQNNTILKTRRIPPPNNEHAVSSKSSSSKQSSSSSFRFVELFAGIGGFRLGLEAIGGRCVLASEISPYAASIYHANFQDDNSSCLIEGDVLDLDTTDDDDDAVFPSQYEMLTAGFPCQPFTTRGEQRGLDDDRGQLYREVARILQETQPLCFILENVSGLVTMGEGGFRGKRERNQRTVFRVGSVLARILHVLREDCGYTVDWKVLNSWRWLPQQRERVFIVGIRKDLTTDPSFFQWDGFFENNTTTDDDAADTNQDVDGNNSTTISSDDDRNTIIRKNGVSSKVRDILEPKHSPAVVASELSESQWKKVQSLHAKRNTVPAVDGCIHVDGKAPTLISSYHRVSSVSTKYMFEQSDGTICDGSVGKRRPRFLTPRECCRIMGFPDTYRIVVPNNNDNNNEQQRKGIQVHKEGHFYHGIGNAVTPPVVSQVGAELWRCVCEATKKRKKGFE
mmetsp:Transcript_10487/g.16005  ORF Transcript_10487/g.16005 Transcript_10487/m.16005 type:complete len:573 (+) Transcript_10487:62-1780(+)